MSYKQYLIWIATVWICAAELTAQTPPQLTSPASAQQTDSRIENAASTATVRGRVQVADTTKSSKKRREPVPGTVVWLTPLTSTGEDPLPALTRSPGTFRLVQKNKSFEPHILVVPAGAQVEFPNHDPFFHNVFSLFEGKRFDLGLYEAGTSRMVRFDRPGISYIFCNIHPEMSAVVITLTTPLYAISNADGQLSLPGVPYGRYVLHIWSEGMGPENAQPLTREVTIADNASSLGVIRVPEADGLRTAHKNKYGRDYDDPAPNNSVYNH
jgi:plastocyanin